MKAKHLVVGILTGLMLLAAAPIWSLSLTQQPSELWVKVQGTGLLPFGELASYTYAGVGGGAGIEAEDVFIQHLRVGLDLDYDYFISSVAWLDALQHIDVVASGGYRFDFAPNLSLTPRLGLGVGPTFVSGGGTSSSGSHGIVEFGAAFGWKFLPDWRLDASLGYRGQYYFSPAEWLSAGELGVGVAWELPLTWSSIFKTGAKK